MSEKRTVVFVDFDGTLYKGDSMVDFLFYTAGGLRSVLLFVPLIPSFIFSSDKAMVKSEWMRRVWKFWREEELKDAAERFSFLLTEKCNQKVEHCIRNHIEQGHEIVILSASLQLWLKPFTERRGFKLIATEEMFSEGVFAGFNVTKNLKGKMKLECARAFCDFTQTNTVAYGNEKSDLFLLNEVNQGIWVNGNKIYEINRS
jgi:phosphatidylglycerophosphatase C